MSEKKNFSFPQGFLWGAATSSHQVEGHNTLNDWHEWELQGKTRHPSGDACDQWHRYDEDFALASSLGHNAHRLSIEWSRIEPSEGVFDQTALEHYRQVILSLKKHKLEPIVTLNHFTLPQWFIKKDGWFHPKASKLFARYSEHVAKALGDDVRFWVTLNEPLVYLYKGYMEGVWPPGEKSLARALGGISKLVHAHIASYRAIKKSIPAHKRHDTHIGIAHNLVCFDPCNPRSWRDRWVAFLRHILYNRLFIDAIALPFFPKSLDFIGINYYTREFVEHSASTVIGNTCSQQHEKHSAARNSLGWEIYPEGIYRVLNIFKGKKLPLYILENGICTDRDEVRCEFVTSHLRGVAKAIQEGLPVHGYFHWSLLDNFEWAEGFDPRFGLVEVDFKTQKRTPRPSAHVLAQVCRSNSLSL